MSSTTEPTRGALSRLWRGVVWTLGLLVLALLLVIAMSCARLIWVEDATVRQAAPAHGRWVRAHDVELYVQEFGDPAAPALVLTHGTGAWSGTWASNVDAMAEAGYRVIAVDLPPFGFSTRPASRDYSRQAQARRILGLIDSLHRPVTLLGHSYGGGPAAEAAMLAPDRIKHLILVDAAIGLTERPASAPADKGWLGTLFNVRPLRTAAIATVGTQPLLSEFWLKKFVARKEVVTSSRTAIYLKPFVVEGFSASLGDWAQQFAGEHGAALSERPEGFRKMAVPLTLLWGAEDTITPLSQAHSLNRLVARSKLVILPGVGHIPQIEDVAQFNRRLADVLQPGR